MIRKLPAGSKTPRPSISWFNAVADTVNKVQGQKSSVAPGELAKLPRPAVVCFVKNVSGADVGRFRPLDIDGVVLTDSDDLVFRGITGEGGRWVITQEPIPDGFTGLAVLSGLTRAYMTGTEGTSLSSGDGVLEFATGIGQPVYVPAGSSERLGVVLIDGATTPPCAEYFTIRSEFGAITGSFDWKLILVSDGSTVASGTFTVGTSTSTTIKTAIDTAIGSGFSLDILGTIPGSISLHPNRGLTYSKYDFQTYNLSLTSPSVDLAPFVTVDHCCVVGG